jgi:hypothetical protein
MHGEWQSSAVCDAKSSHRLAARALEIIFPSGSLVFEARFLTALFLQVPLVRLGRLDHTVLFARLSLGMPSFLQRSPKRHLLT